MLIFESDNFFEFFILAASYHPTIQYIPTNLQREGAAESIQQLLKKIAINIYFSEYKYANFSFSLSPFVFTITIMIIIIDESCAYR